MRIRLYVDEDAMDKDLLQALRARGVDVLTAFETGMIERSDEDHLEFVTRKGRVLYSFNLQFPVVLLQGLLSVVSCMGGKGWWSKKGVSLCLANPLSHSVSCEI